MTESEETQQRLRAWSYWQQQLGRVAQDPHAALRILVAVYSSHPTAPLVLLSRSTSFTANTLIEMEQRRAVVRLPGIRGSIFLMPTETAPKIFAATPMPMKKLEPRLRYAGLDWEDYAHLKQRVLDLATEPVTANALQDAIETDGKLMTAVRLMTYEGLVLRIGTTLRSDNLRYVSTAAWLGQPLAQEDADNSLRWLAEAYLRGYGPARIADFAWWSGTTRRRATAAIKELDVVDISAGMFLLAEQQSACATVESIDPDAIDILPKWDAYTMGYAPDGRQRFVNDEHRHLAYTTSGGTIGDGLPLILRGGRAVASWSHRFTSNTMRVMIRPFEADSPPRPLDDEDFEAIGQVLGATSIEAETANPSP